MWPFKKKKIPDEFIMVQRFHMDVTVGSNSYDPVQGRLSFYLYESSTGRRKWEAKSGVAKANDNYNAVGPFTEKIYPWFKGEDFDDIPSYWDLVKGKRKQYVREMYKRLLKG